MASRLGDDDGDVIADINITPFVDVVLVVLIMFMLSASAIEQREMLNVDLPEAANADPKSVSLGLSLTTDGGLRLDGRSVTPDQLRAEIQRAQADNNEVRCVIAADKAVAHGRVVWLMDLIKSEGVAKMGFNIDPAAMVPSDPATRGEGVGPLPGEG